MITKMCLVLFIGFVVRSDEYRATGATTTRQPSIQAYGLPKRIQTGYNGYIERIHIDERSTEPKDFRHSDRSEFTSIGRRFVPRLTIDRHDDPGVIEIFHGDSDNESVSRNTRSIDGADGIENPNDLRAEETKVFRPLFVYRQQMLAKQRRQRSERERRNNASSARSNKNSSRLHYRSRGSD